MNRALVDRKLTSWQVEKIGDMKKAQSCFIKSNIST